MRNLGSKCFTFIVNMHLFLHISHYNFGFCQNIEFSLLPTSIPPNPKCDASFKAGETVFFRGILNVSGLSQTEIENSTLGLHYQVYFLDVVRYCAATFTNGTCVHDEATYCLECYEQDKQVYEVAFNVTLPYINYAYQLNICMFWSDADNKFETKNCTILNVYGERAVFYEWIFGVHLAYNNLRMNQDTSYIQHRMVIPLLIHELQSVRSVSINTKATMLYEQSFTSLRSFELKYFNQSYSEIKDDIFASIQGDHCRKAHYWCSNNIIEKGLPVCDPPTLTESPEHYLFLNLNCVIYDEYQYLDLNYDNPAYYGELIEDSKQSFNGSSRHSISWQIYGYNTSVSMLQNMPFSINMGYFGTFEYGCVDISNTEVNVTLSADCPRGPGVKNGYIRRGTTAECGCEVSSPNYAVVKWFNSDNLTVSTKNESVLEITNTGNETSQEYICRANYFYGESASVVFVAKYFYGPDVLQFTVNETNSSTVRVGERAFLKCEVQGDPPAKALINGSGLGQVKEIQSNTSVLELVLEDLQCEDSGRYFCMGVNGFEESGTMDQNFVDIYIVCQLKIRNPKPEIPVVHVSRDKNTVFTLEIYGYPEPTKFGLKIESGNSVSDLDKKTYDISYISTVPPFGLVTVTFYDKTTRVITTYILSVTNTEGELQLKFDVINQDIKSNKADNIETINCVAVILLCITALYI